MRKICIFLLVLFCGNVIRSQVNPAVQDTTKTQFSVGKLELKNPPSVLSGYKYDPATSNKGYKASTDKIINSSKYGTTATLSLIYNPGK